MQKEKYKHFTDHQTPHYFKSDKNFQPPPTSGLFSPIAQTYGAIMEPFCQRYMDHPRVLKNCMFHSFVQKKGPFVKVT